MIHRGQDLEELGAFTEIQWESLSSCEAPKTSEGPLKLLTLLCLLICHCRSLPCRGFFLLLFRETFSIDWNRAVMCQLISDSHHLKTAVWNNYGCESLHQSGLLLDVGSWTRSQTWYCSILPGRHKLDFAPVFPTVGILSHYLKFCLMPQPLGL